MQKIELSVIVPVYNVSNYIKECLNSLVIQTYKDAEIILIDDGSTDGSGLICDEYSAKYENIRTIHKSNEGLGSTRNRGLYEAKGEYIYFIDGDDSLNENAFERMLLEAQKNKLDVLMFSATPYPDDININYNRGFYSRTKYLNTVYNGLEMLTKLFESDEYYANTNLRLYRLDFIKEHGLLFPEEIIHEDEVFGFLSLVYSKRTECINDKLYNRRYRRNSIMTDGSAYESCLGYCYTYKKIIEYLKHHPEYENNERKEIIKFANKYINLIQKKYINQLSNEQRDGFNTRIEEMKLIFTSEDLYFDKYLYSFLCKPNSIVRRKEINREAYKKIYGYINKIITKRKQKLLFNKSLRKLSIQHLLKRKTAVLIGTPTHGNLGDHAIVLAEKKFLRECNGVDAIVEFSSSDYLSNKETIKNYIKNEDIIIIDGGGNIGTLWVHNEMRHRDVVKTFPNNKIYIFPETTYYENNYYGKLMLKKTSEIFSKHRNLIITCRDRSSYDICKQNFVNNKILYIPDIALILCPIELKNKRTNTIYLCFRDDIEKVVNNKQQSKLKDLINDFGKYDVEVLAINLNKYIDRKNRKQELERKWKEFSTAALVITDRLHAMLFCVLTNTPCIATDNISKKVSGAYEWIKNIDNIKYVESLDEIDASTIDIVINNTNRKKIIFKQEYKPLKDAIEE